MSIDSTKQPAGTLDARLAVPWLTVLRWPWCWPSPTVSG